MSKQKKMTSWSMYYNTVITNENNYCLNAFHVTNMGEEQAFWLIYALTENPILLLGYGKRDGN
jgi:hypothetical protein